MIKDNIVELLNEQVNKEMESAYIYLDFVNYYIDKGLDGFANWYRVQAQEEMDHANLFMQYMQNNGLSVKLKNINAPEIDYKGNDTPLHEGLKHEQYITKSIHDIYDLAFQEKDYRTMQFLDWFVMEQGEEETNAEELIQKYENFAGDSQGLYLLNQELAARVHTPPSLVLD